MVKSDFDTYDSGAKAVPHCTLCGWSIVMNFSRGTSPKRVTEKANEAMTKHLRAKHGVFEKNVSKGKKWI